MKKITKAVIPAAGLGTRMLPAAKAVPKEMMSIVDKPAIQYLVEEAVNSGITDILIITNRGKSAIEDYFDYAPEYEKKLLDGKKEQQLKQLRDIANLCNIQYVRQKDAKGLGHAVYCAKQFIGNEPFAVLYGDDIIDSPAPVTGKLIEVFEKYGKLTVGVQQVAPEWVVKYCTLDAAEVARRTYTVKDMIEKPKPEQIITNLSILGRVVLPPEIFPILENQTPGAGGEIQLTDAMAKIARESGIMAYEYEGVRHDMGSKIGFLMANVSMGIKHDEVGREFTEWLKNFVKNI